MQTRVTTTTRLLSPSNKDNGTNNAEQLPNANDPIIGPTFSDLVSQMGYSVLVLCEYLQK